MNDPNVLAEQELLNAANAIELAAQKLSELKPRPLNRDEGTNKELNFEGQILDAANSIMKATSFLIAAATSAQKELVQKGVFKTKADDKSGTGQWSQGLISAARLVADSTNMLCDAAKAAVEGKASEEKLIAACNAISGSTSQLIMACKVKADPNSENQARLEKAGYSVKKASKTFVESLQGSGVFERKQENIELVTTKVGGLKQEIDALEEIAKHERELKEARDKLIKLRQAKAAPKKDQ
uniref:Talin-1 (Trinotate prediction) n=1 Tax=Myxobolus squamalis TaxID=59785 RepID=A0A6B2G2G6_MYXSQ